MASAYFPVDTSATATAAGRNLLYLRDQLEQAWYGLKAHFAAMAQEKNGDGSLDSHFAPCVDVYGFKANAGDGTNTANHSAKACYDELNSMIGNAAGAVEQLLARLKQ